MGKRKIPLFDKIFVDTPGGFTKTEKKVGLVTFIAVCVIIGFTLFVEFA